MERRAKSLKPIDMKRHQLHSLANILGAVHDLGEDQLQFVLHLVHLVKTSMPTREHSVTALALRLGLGEQPSASCHREIAQTADFSHTDARSVAASARGTAHHDSRCGAQLRI